MKPTPPIRQRIAFAILLALFLSPAFLQGCDGVYDANEPRDESAVALDGSKFRHAQMMDMSYKTKPGAGKTGASSLGIVFAVNPMAVVDRYAVLDRYKVLDRYAVLDRYKVLDRYEYLNVFEGFAITIEDSLGLNDYQAFLTLLENDPDILWYEPDFSLGNLPSEGIAGSIGQMIPWSVAAVGGTQSFTKSGDGTGSVGIDVFVLDTGVSNDDLNVVESIDFRDSTMVTAPDPVDRDGHGTHVAGIIGAIDDNDGLVGVAPGVRIHNYKVLNDEGGTDVSVAIAAVEQILTKKLAEPARPMVVNMSLGEDISSESYSALDYAIKAASDAGVIFVAAAGNQSIDAKLVTPAHAKEVITVGAYNVMGRFTSFSNFGKSVDILAPGEFVVSLSANGGPMEMSGTSMAAAHVTGAVALYLAQHPGATQAEVLAALSANAKNFVVGQPAETTNLSVWVGEEDSASISQTYRDEFTAIAFNGSNGSAAWAGNWQEIGESNGPSAGRVRVAAVANCVSGNCIRFYAADANRGLRRAVDLGSVTSATLSLYTHRKSTGGKFSLDISSDGGSTWHTLKSYADGADVYPTQETYDISAYASSTTQIRFYSAKSGTGQLLIDEVEIKTNAMSAGDGLSYDHLASDKFEVVSFGNNDGNATWSAGWKEMGETDGAGSGRVFIGPGTLNKCPDGTCLNIRGDWNGMGVYREIDLSGAQSARLTYQWLRYQYGSTFNVEVSRNGGASWATLQTMGNGNDSMPTKESFDLTPYLSGNTVLRFQSTGAGNIGFMLIDDVQIEF